ncbi:uncharacterized protein K02A2.6-like [Uranotaenia lowii]|uniref:uncharacterized protein K02A2.6-like n=1 Tax=Uranotaenia lowii TaxID=190385 RepID=UPI002478792F|nr:uncharacterized protein K02A2.6-like [Uranotaenia lowii]
MTSITAENTIEQLRIIFSRFGIPITLTADNAPQLSEDCEEFSTFCNIYGIKLINTVPYWPQMNGEVERQNRTILKRLQISQELGQDWRIELQRFLLTYRTSAHTVTGRSPAEMMFGRKIRNKLPQLTESALNDEVVRDRDSFQKEKGREYVDTKRRAKASDISVGDYVLLKRMRKENKLSTEYINEEFVVLSKRGADLTVKSLATGKEFRRNTAHAKKIERTDTETSSNADMPESPVGSGSIPPSKQSNGETSLKHVEKRKPKEPAWFESYVPH